VRRPGRSGNCEMKITEKMKVGKLVKAFFQMSAGLDARCWILDSGLMQTAHYTPR
jgi:hypothetical protein